MEVLSIIALILLSLVGYSMGTTIKAGKYIDLKPQLLDLLLVLAIWVLAIYSRIEFELNRWILILIWLILSGVIGVLTVLLRTFPKERSKTDQSLKLNTEKSHQRIWESWKSLSRKMGAFQSRIIISFFYFLIASPFALAVKIFSDPLKLKHRESASYWNLKTGKKVDLEQSRRQF